MIPFHRSRSFAFIRLAVSKSPTRTLLPVELGDGNKKLDSYTAEMPVASAVRPMYPTRAIDATRDLLLFTSIGCSAFDMTAVSAHVSRIQHDWSPTTEISRVELGR